MIRTIENKKKQYYKFINPSWERFMRNIRWYTNYSGGNKNLVNMNN